MVLPLVVRRLILPVTVAIELVLLVLMVPLAAVGTLSWIVDRRLRLLRLAAMGAAYLTVELAALCAMLWVWLVSPVRGQAATDDATLAVLGWALGAILGAARRTVGFEVILPDQPTLVPFEDEPVLVLARHGGVGDSYVLVWLLAACYRRSPRVVLKAILLWEPLLDVALSRLGACFLPRSARSPGDREALIGSTAATLGPRDALLLFPEGGNWTPARHRSAVRRLRLSHKPEAARAAGLMEHVLPPRPGGVLACLDARPDLPVVVVAHTGLEDVTSPGLLWASLPFTAPMAIRWWPVAAAPAGAEDRLAWLTTEWAIVDQWIDARRSGRPV